MTHHTKLPMNRFLEKNRGIFWCLPLNWKLLVPLIWYDSRNKIYTLMVKYAFYLLITALIVTVWAFLAGHGNCIGHDECQCESNWHGVACSIPDCSKVSDCSKQGDCIAPNKCECYFGFDGAYCDQKAKPNLHAPAFDFQFYKAFINENTSLGAHVLQVRANDSDSGRNGEVLYSLVDNRKSDATLLFVIDSASGKISTSTVLDYDTVSVHSHNLTVMASDNGLPQKSAFSTVQVEVRDINDNCPVFTEPTGPRDYHVVATVKPGTVITRVWATDRDSGRNGLVTYSISSYDQSSKSFSIDTDRGIIVTLGALSVMRYRLTVIARDHGTPSCIQNTDILVDAVALPTDEPTSPKGKKKNHTLSLSYKSFL